MGGSWSKRLHDLGAAAEPFPLAAVAERLHEDAVRNSTFDKFKAFLLSWIPLSFSEAFLFIITVTLVIIVVNLFHHTSIQRRIKKESRCYRDALINRPNVGVYTVKGYSMNTGTEVFEVVYDLGAKTFTVNQKCPTGNVQNRVNIPVYSLQTYTSEEMNKVFNCEENFNLENGTRVIYRGYPELVRFMQYGNTDFFDKMLS